MQETYENFSRNKAISGMVIDYQRKNELSKKSSWGDEQKESLIDLNSSRI